MSCPFYGKHAVPEMKMMVGQSGNQCALVTSHFAPCTLEMAGDPAPRLENCEWEDSQRARDFVLFENRRQQVVYPD